MTHVTCRLTAKTGISSGTVRSAVEYRLPLPFLLVCVKVSREEWPDNNYPTYCSGSAFLMSTDVAVAMHRVSYDVPFFWVDDFYITGLLPLKLGPSVVRHTQFISSYVLNGRLLEEKFTGPQWYQYVFSHVHNLNAIQSVWKTVVQLARGKIQPTIPFALPGHLPKVTEAPAKGGKKPR